MKRGPTGRYEVQTVGGETVRAFIPLPLPPDPPVVLQGPLQSLLEKASLALKYLGEVLHIAKLPPRTEAFDVLCTMLSQSHHEVTTLLWNTYHPGLVWLPFAVAGFMAAVALAVFNHYVKKTNWNGSV